MGICTFLFSLAIVGAVETSPGMMEVTHLDPVDGQIYISNIYTDDYLKCWKTNDTSNGVSLKK